MLDGKLQTCAAPMISHVEFGKMALEWCPIHSLFICSNFICCSVFGQRGSQRDVICSPSNVQCVVLPKDIVQGATDSVNRDVISVNVRARSSYWNRQKSSFSEFGHLDRPVKRHSMAQQWLPVSGDFWGVMLMSPSFVMSGTMSSGPQETVSTTR
jgi:hypothetical protein